MATLSDPSLQNLLAVFYRWPTNRRWERIKDEGYRQTIVALALRFAERSVAVATTAATAFRSVTGAATTGQAGDGGAGRVAAGEDGWSVIRGVQLAGVLHKVDFSRMRISEEGGQQRVWSFDCVVAGDCPRSPSAVDTVGPSFLTSDPFSCLLRTATHPTTDAAAFPGAPTAPFTPIAPATNTPPAAAPSSVNPNIFIFCQPGRAHQQASTHQPSCILSRLPAQSSHAQLQTQPPAIPAASTPIRYPWCGTCMTVHPAAANPPSTILPTNTTTPGAVGPPPTPTAVLPGVGSPLLFNPGWSSPPCTAKTSNILRGRVRGATYKHRKRTTPAAAPPHWSTAAHQAVQPRNPVVQPRDAESPTHEPVVVFAYEDDHGRWVDMSPEDSGTLAARFPGLFKRIAALSSQATARNGGGHADPGTCVKEAAERARSSRVGPSCRTGPSKGAGPSSEAGPANLVLGTAGGQWKGAANDVVVEVSLSGTQYVVDFGAMTQTRCSTGRQRQIRCTVGGAVIGAAEVEPSERGFELIRKHVLGHTPLQELSTHVHHPRHTYARGGVWGTGATSRKAWYEAASLTTRLDFSRLTASVGDTILPLETHDPRFRALAQFSGEALGGNPVKVTAIHAVQPVAHRLEGFIQEVKWMEGQGKASNLRLLWHGTSLESAKSISVNRFGVGDVSNGSLFGRGVYFAANAKTSARYAERDRNGERHMLLCLVVLGKVEVSSSNQTFAKPGFDSGSSARIDEGGEPWCYVMWSNRLDRILTLAVISFQRDGLDQ